MVVQQLLLKLKYFLMAIILPSRKEYGKNECFIENYSGSSRVSISSASVQFHEFVLL